MVSPFIDPINASSIKKFISQTIYEPNIEILLQLETIFDSRDTESLKLSHIFVSRVEDEKAIQKLKQGMYKIL